MANSSIVDRQALSVVFTDPRTLLAFERSLKFTEVAPEAIAQAQADADQALAETALLRAPTYIVQAGTAILDNERILAGGTGVTINFGTPGQAIIQVSVPGSLGYTPLNPANNLSDVANAATSRNNLGLGTAAVQSVAFFLQAANNLSDVANAATARGNLGLGALATQASVAAALGNQTANLIYAGPASGAAAAPAFRTMVVADLPTPPTFSAHRNAVNQTVASGSFQKVQCTTTEWNTGACYDAAVNYRFTPNVAGKYGLDGAVNVTTVAAATVTVAVFKNGVEYKRGALVVLSAGSSVAVPFSILADANGSTDYFEVFVYQDSGSNATVGGGTMQTFFQGVWHAR